MMTQKWTVMAVAMAAAAGSIAQPGGTPTTTTPPGKPAISVQPGGKPSAPGSVTPPVVKPPAVQPGAGQPGGPAVPPPPPPPPPRTLKAVKWTDGDCEKLGGMLSGTWKTTKPVAQFGGEAGATTDILINIAPVAVEGLTDTLYVEASRPDATWAPYHQGVFQIHKFKGGLRLRTLEFHKAADGKPSEFAGSLAGLWLDPIWFPELKKEQLHATMEIDLKPAGTGYKGSTTVPYPTSTSGAVEMTSEMTIEPGKLITADRWYGADGKVVFGSQAGDAYTFAKAPSPVKLNALSEGLKVIEFKTGNDGKAIADGDDVVAHYTGYLVENGTKFDSSRDMGRPMGPFKQGSLIVKGWNEGLVGYHEGDRLKLLVPWAKALGERGGGRGRIPPYADMIYDIEVMKVDAPVDPNQAGPGPGPGPAVPNVNASGPKPVDPKAEPPKGTQPPK